MADPYRVPQAILESKVVRSSGTRVSRAFRPVVVVSSILAVLLGLFIWGYFSPLSRDHARALAEGELQKVAANHTFKLDDYTADPTDLGDASRGYIAFRWFHKAHLAPPIYVSVLTKEKIKIRVYRDCADHTIETLRPDRVIAEKCYGYKTPY